MRMNKDLVIVGVLVLVVSALFFFLGDSDVTGSVTAQQVEIIPLSNEERVKVAQTVEASEFVEDLPKKGIIALQFYSFNDAGRVWRDGFLVGKGGLVSEGEPDIYLALHAKYIDRIDNNLCDIIKDAKENGDMIFHSEKSKPRLLIKFAGMLKHRDCFGF